MLDTLRALTAEKVSQLVTITLMHRTETQKGSNGHRGNKKMTGREQDFKKAFIGLLKLHNVV